MAPARFQLRHSVPRSARPPPHGGVAIAAPSGPLRATVCARSRALVVVALLAIAVTWAPGPPNAAAQDDSSPQPDQYYAGMLAQSGLTIAERTDVELTGDGIDETVLTAVKEGCGSCPEKRLVVFAGQRSLAEVALDDPTITVQPGIGIAVSQPVRLPDEARCCPSASYTLQLVYDPTVRQRDGVEVAGQLVFAPSISIQHVASAERAPLHSVAVYYALLAAGRFEQAYELLADEYRGQWYFPLWLRAQLEADEPVLAEIAPIPDSPGEVRVKVEEVDPESGLTTQVYAGSWQTVVVDGTPRLARFSRAVG